MVLILALIAASVLPDPASVTVALEDTPHGLLFTDGRRCGLYITEPDGSCRTISELPGAGGNVVVAEDGVFFKECPAGGEQRVVFTEWDGSREVLYSNDHFSGPFPCDDSFMVAVDGRATAFDGAGRTVGEWTVSGYPAAVLLVDDNLFYTLETGGLSFTGLFPDRNFTRLAPGPSGAVLAEMSPAGFLVFSKEGELLHREEDGITPSWTPQGEIVYSVLDYDGLFPCGGEIRLLDPVSGSRELLADGEAALHPLVTIAGDLLRTDLSGDLCGARALVPRNGAAGGAMDDPQAHFDVEYMHQRWDTPDWFNGSWSCGPTSCVMTTQYYLRLTPDSIWASYPSPGHWSQWGNYIPCEYTFLGHTYDVLGESPGGLVPGAHGFICPDGGAWWNLMVEFLTQHGIYSAWAGTSWSTLTDEIDSFYPVVCSSTVLGCGHIILFNGYYDDHTVVVNDPYGDANEPGWGSYYNGKDVLYDWPGYNNGHVQIGVSQLFYARSDVPSEPDTLVDDCSRGFFKFADCRYWHLAGSGFQGEAWWTYSTGAPPDTCFARWHPVLPWTGDYEVMVYVPPDHAEATGIYRISTVSGMEEVYMDQGLYSDEWVSLGVHPLDQESYLSLGDYTGTGGEHIAFDAALFSPAGTGIGGGSVESLPGVDLGPNPCRGVLHLDGSGWPVDTRLGIYDLSGRLVMDSRDWNAGGPSTVDLSSLCPGVYMVRLETGDSSASRLLTICD